MDTDFNNMLQLVCYNQTLVSSEVLLFYATALDKTFKTNLLLSKLGMMMMMMIPVSQGDDEMC